MHVSFSNVISGQFLGRYWGRFSGQKILLNCHPGLWSGHIHLKLIFFVEVERQTDLDRRHLQEAPLESRLIIHAQCTLLRSTEQVCGGAPDNFHQNFIFRRICLSAGPEH